MQNRKFNIMQIIPELGIGGAEQGCIDVAEAIHLSGNNSFIVSYGGTRVHELRQLKSTFIKLPVHSKNPFTIWSNITKLRSLIRKHKIDVVHVRSRAPAWSAYFACKSLGVPMVCTVHSTYSGNDSYFKRLYNSSMMRGHHTIAISQTISDYINQSFTVNPSSLTIINRGVDISYFNPQLIRLVDQQRILKQWGITADKPIFLMPARITPRKGHLLLLDALELLSEKNYWCVILGPIQNKTKYYNQLLNLIDKKKLSKQVIIADASLEMPLAYSVADFVLTPSVTPEAFGRIAVEAQAMGKPVIATDYGEYRYTVHQNKTGWKFPVKDAKAFASCIENAMNISSSEKSYMSDEAICNVHKNYTKSQMCAETIKVYQKLVTSD